MLMYEKLDGVMRVRNQHKKKKNSDKWGNTIHSSQHKGIIPNLPLSSVWN